MASYRGIPSTIQLKGKEQFCKWKKTHNENQAGTFFAEKYIQGQLQDISYKFGAIPV